MNEKTCTKCSKIYPATLEYFYKNAGGKYGITPRCKPCVNEDNIASHAARLIKDPDKIRELANQRSKRNYYKNIEASRKRQCDHQAKARGNPEKYAVIKARKRAGGAGLKPHEIEQIRDSQNNLCAICSNPDPTDLDHCHQTKRVRWLLCKHCNRGLGAFRDRPDLLRKAAYMLENNED